MCARPLQTDSLVCFSLRFCPPACDVLAPRRSDEIEVDLPVLSDALREAFEPSNEAICAFLTTNIDQNVTANVLASTDLHDRPGCRR